MNIHAKEWIINQQHDDGGRSAIQSTAYLNFHLSSFIFHLPKLQHAKRIVWGILLALLLPAMNFSNIAWARENRNETTVFVVGSGHIRGEDMSAGRQEAIDNGLVMAVSRVLIELLPSETMAGSFQVLNDVVLSHTDQYVRDYKVLTESTVSDTYRLLVLATVSTRRLKEAVQKAGVRLGRIQYPRILLCVAEKGIRVDVPQYWWSGRNFGEGAANAVLAKLFSEKGYVVVQSGAVAAANYPPELKAAEAAAIGQQLKADIVVTGLASVEPAANTMGGTVHSYRGTLNATAYRVSDGLLIAQAPRTALAAGNDAISGSREAMNSVASMVGEDLVRQIGDVWFTQSSGTTQVEIVVQGLGGNIANFVKFRGALSNSSGIDSLQLKEMMSGTAVLAVAYQGQAQVLADALLLLEFDSFGIDIENVEGETIRVQLVPKESKSNEEN